MLFCSSPFLSPLVTATLFSISVNVSFLLYSICCIYKISYKFDNTVFLFFWLISLSIIISKQSMLQMTKCHSFLWLRNMLLCIYTTFLYTFTCWWTFRSLPYLGHYRWCCMNIGVYVSFSISIFNVIKIFDAIFSN